MIQEIDIWLLKEELAEKLKEQEKQRMAKYLDIDIID